MKFSAVANGLVWGQAAAQLLHGGKSPDGTIDVIEPLGTESVVHATRPDGEPIDFVTDETAEIFPDDTVTVGFDEEDLIVFGPNGEAVVYGARLFDSAGATQQIN